MRSGNGGSIYCEVDEYPVPDCANVGAIAAGRFEWLNVQWYSASQTFTSSADASSASVSCYSGGGVTAIFDLVYLSEAPGAY